MWHAGLEEAQAGIKIAGRHINNLRYADDTTGRTEREEELKSLLMKVKEEREKAGLKLNIQKAKIMASGPITSWKQWKQWQTLEDGDCSHESKRHFLLGRKAMTNLDSILKSRDTTFLTKVHIIKATVFLVVMYGCESWTIKKAECWRIDPFELWWWRRLLRVTWTARRLQPVHRKGKQSWLVSGRTDDEAQAPIHWPPDAKNWLIWKDPDAGKDWRQEEKGMTEDEMVGWHHQLDGH